jgi:hypothetical protein
LDGGLKAARFKISYRDKNPAVQSFILPENLVGPAGFVDKFRKGSLQGSNDLLVRLGYLVRINRNGTIQFLGFQGHQEKEAGQKGQ